MQSIINQYKQINNLIYLLKKRMRILALSQQNYQSTSVFLYISSHNKQKTNKQSNLNEQIIQLKQQNSIANQIYKIKQITIVEKCLKTNQLTKYYLQNYLSYKPTSIQIINNLHKAI
ncbi:hypothetical protein ABPG74_011363 [Tetrahymena malaccensis]